jgi:4-alpha-glucanotransferase
MSDSLGPPPAIPFAPDYRASGVLLHITSLPSPYGIGDFGPQALAFVDWLVGAGQSWWQTLPLGPPDRGNSPYQSPSTFALNTSLISPDRLRDDGLLLSTDLASAAFPNERVDYDAVVPFKAKLLRIAWDRFFVGDFPQLRSQFENFCNREEHWLNDFALFMALKGANGDVDYFHWPTQLVWRDSEALATARKQHAHAIDQVRFEQFLAFRQLEALKDYARRHGLRLLGDLPFFVSPDSADVWANPELFLLDEQQHARFVGGVPPDYFSADGQLWGNPVYDWEVLRRTGYRWWIDRLRALLAQADVLRLDHFRAFSAAWHIPAGAANARGGEWIPGPGADFFEAVGKALGGLPLVAEDLGMITDDVRALRDQFHLPGMRVLQFAFDGDPMNPFLPANYIHNTVAYTGTHDNNTTRGWYESLSESERKSIWRQLEHPEVSAERVAETFVDLAWNSAAALAIAPLQDLLNLDGKARMNVPGSSSGNWNWRVTEEMLTPDVLDRLRHLTQQSKRENSLLF